MASSMSSPLGRLSNKVAIVTGSSSGIGRAIALAYIREGAKVVCADIKPSARPEIDHETSATTFEILQKEGGTDRSIAVPTDVSNGKDVQALVEQAVKHFGRLDIIVNNAGIAPPPSMIHEISEDEWDRVMGVNARSVFLGSKYAIIQMLKQPPHPNGERGWIINIASIGGLVGVAMAPSYSASKGAVAQTTKQVAVDYAKHRIHCNAICPGYTKTAVLADAFKYMGDQTELLGGMHPFGGLGEVDDITGPAVFLASADAKWITGVLLAVDGGFTAQAFLLDATPQETTSPTSSSSTVAFTRWKNTEDFDKRQGAFIIIGEAITLKNVPSLKPSESKTSDVDPATHAEVLQILGDCFFHEDFEDRRCDLDWYPNWLANQLGKIDRHELHSNLRWAVSYENWADADNESTSPVDPSPLDSDFLTIFRAVKSNACEGPIDHIINLLIDEGVFKDNGGDQATDFMRENLVFAMLGWLSMLYSPCFDHEVTTFKIRHDSNQPNSRLVYETFVVDSKATEHEPACFLKKFGNLLPARHRALAVTAGQRNKTVSSMSPISPTKFNMQVLSTLLRIRVQWVDTIALHLDYDQTTRTLSLFRYPSICVHQYLGGAIHSFASSDWRSPDPRADSNDITSILVETLLSFRLLFGQSTAGRKHFRRLFRSNPELQTNGDRLLFALCAEPHFEHYVLPNNSPIFFLDRDFPVLGGRIKLLMEDLKESRPQGWRQLLRDRRDTVQYWTFWLVAVFGAISIMLSMIQVILAGLALR